jgi:hypothetical protein
LREYKVEIYVKRSEEKRINKTKGKIPYDHIYEGKYHIDIYVKERKKNEVDNTTKNVNFSTFHFILPTDKKSLSTDRFI